MKILIARGFFVLLLAAPVAAPAADFPVRLQPVADEKAVFATVESLNVVPARARIGGTVAVLAVRNGDAVTQGQVLAVVGDPKLALQMNALEAQIAGAQSQLLQAQADLARAETLLRQGSGPRVTYDQAHTAVEVAASTLHARTAERDVTRQQMTEGEVLAPATGRVLDVPVTRGTVALAGDTLATVAERSYVLRLRVPERHAVFLKVGDPVRVDAAELGGGEPGFGRITLVYPRIQDGRVVADAVLPDLRRRISSASASASGSPPARGGDRGAGSTYRDPVWPRHVRLRRDGAMIDVPVQRGQPHPTPEMPDGIEILSGLRAGDVGWSRAMNLGLSGRLTRATIRSQLTPLFLLAALAAGLLALCPSRARRSRRSACRWSTSSCQRQRTARADAAELVTKPLEDHRQGDQRRRARLQPDEDDQVMVTARFLVGQRGRRRAARA